jgi:hypothetical protein
VLVQRMGRPSPLGIPRRRQQQLETWGCCWVNVAPDLLLDRPLSWQSRLGMLRKQPSHGLVLRSSQYKRSLEVQSGEFPYTAQFAMCIAEPAPPITICEGDPYHRLRGPVRGKLDGFTMFTRWYYFHVTSRWR